MKLFLVETPNISPLQKCSGWASHGQEMQGHKSGAKRPLQSPGTAGAAGRGYTDTMPMELTRAN